MIFPFSGFICLCEKAGAIPSHNFREKLEMKSEDAVFRVMYSEECLVAEKAGVTAILHGRLFHGLTPGDIPGIYRKYGQETGNHLPGSYALLILDRAEQKAVIISDRISSRPLYFSQWEGSWIVSTSFIKLTNFIPHELSLDFAGISWYLSNGIIHNSHTLFSEVRRLERATLYTGDAGSFKAYEYWKFRFGKEEDGMDERQLINRMKEVLTASVSDCIPKDDPVYLSLSGGYDSSGILAVMKNALKLRDVTTFAYGLNENQPQSDPSIAHDLAAVAGYPHLFRLSYQHDFNGTLDMNVIWGDGVSNFCDEILVWQQFKAGFQGQRPVCLFGDTIFADGIYNELLNEKDVLDAILIRDMEYLPWLETYLGPGMFGKMKSVLEDECGHLLKKSRSGSNSLLDQANYLVIEARSRNAHVPWRANFCSRAFTPVNPLYHDDCLDFQLEIPGNYRKRKGLFIKTVKEMAPAFFELERARYMGYVPSWKNEIVQNYQVIAEEHLSREVNFGLDSIIPAEIILQVINKEIINRHKPAHKQGIKSLLNYIPGHHKTPAPCVPAIKKLAPEKFILRYLVLKKTLEMIGEMREQEILHQNPGKPAFSL